MHENNIEDNITRMESCNARPSNEFRVDLSLKFGTSLLSPRLLDFQYSISRRLSVKWNFLLR